MYSGIQFHMNMLKSPTIHLIHSYYWPDHVLMTTHLTWVCVGNIQLATVCYYGLDLQQLQPQHTYPALDLPQTHSIHVCMSASSPDPFSRCTLICTLWIYSIFHHWKEEEPSFIMKNKTKGAKTGGKWSFSSQMYMADAIVELWEISNFLSKQWATGPKIG